MSRNEKLFLTIVLTGTAIRLLAFPFANSVVADATSRVLIAWEWAENPYLITHGGWLPLHFYLIAAGLWIWFDTVHSPALLHIFFSIATAIPLYAFVRQEWGEREALFVSASYLLYPICFRYSFMAENHAPFQFFLILTMYFLSRAIRYPKTSSTVLAGTMSVLASALRYESWIMIPLFGFLLWNQRKQMVIFLAVASSFPLVWMIGNFLHQLHPVGQLPAVLANEALANQGNVGVLEVLRRIIYFPAVIFFGLTPLLSSLCIWGAWILLRDQKRQRVWLIPFAGLLSIFVVMGTLGFFSTAQTRHSATLGLLLLPFGAETFGRIVNRQMSRNIAIVVLLSVLPLSYVRVIFYRVAGPSVLNPFPADLEAIPKVAAEPKQIVSQIRKHLDKEKDGLIIDFFLADGFYSWKDTYYVALESRMHPSRLYIFAGDTSLALNVEDLTALLTERPTGLILLSNPSRHLDFQEVSGQTIIHIRRTNYVLHVRRIASIRGITLYRYANVTRKIT